MRKRLIRGLSTVALLLTAVAPGLAGELPMRSFARFPFDTATAKGFWAEVGVASSHIDDDSDQTTYGVSSEADLITVQPTFAYGGDAWEAGVLVPFVHVDARYCQKLPSLTLCHEIEEDGIGDVDIYGKYILRSELVHVGAGLDFSLPTGDEDKGLGTGELGVAPFATIATIIGPAEIRGHVGNVFYPQSNSSRFARDVPDVFFYGLGLFYAINDVVGVRGEFIGARVDRDLDPDIVSFQPGVDIRIPLGPVDMMIRPTALVGMTDATAEWGIGGAISILQAP